MAQNEKQCPKCGGAMQDGIMIDVVYKSLIGDAAVQPAWVEGVPENPSNDLLNLKGIQRVPVTAYRCAECGYIEQYAKPAGR